MQRLHFAAGALNADRRLAAEHRRGERDRNFVLEIRAPLRRRLLPRGFTPPATKLTEQIGETPSASAAGSCAPAKQVVDIKIERRTARTWATCAARPAAH